MIKLIRKEERLTQQEFSQLTDIPLRTIQKYEQGTYEPSFKVLRQITCNDKLQKYSLWLMTGKTEPEFGQICPTFSTQDMQENMGSISRQNKA